MKPRIRIAFCDFWPGFDARDNYFTQLLGQRFQLEWSDRPDFLIYSAFGREHRRHRCLRIFFTGENIRPDFRVCDYAFTFDHSDNPDHYRLPLYAIYGDVRQLVKRDVDPQQILASKRRFCNFIYTNPHCKPRLKFFDLLSKYKRIDSGGKLRNNMGQQVGNKLAFIRDYKFTIAFENAVHPGYTTEKLAEPMWAGSLPIYWGNPLVHLDFNPRSFLNHEEHGGLEALVERVIAVDRDDELYLQCLRQPWFHDNRVNRYVNPDNVLAAFERIFSTARQPVAQRARPAWFLGGWGRRSA